MTLMPEFSAIDRGQAFGEAARQEIADHQDGARGIELLDDPALRLDDGSATCALSALLGLGSCGSTRLAS